jgi:F420-dependent oxidoreductase-like protein
MELAVTLPYADDALLQDGAIELSRAADRLGYHSIWVAEAWGFDAFMVLTMLAGQTEHIRLGTSIVNVYSRSPALIGQSVATLDALSGGRAILGLGASGPQVVEGWHGVPYRKPVQRTREAVGIVRQVLRRERVTFDGEIFQLGMGLKLLNHPVRDSVPIVVAALGPRNVEMAATVADGWMPTLFMPSRAAEVFGPMLAAGAAARSPELGPLSVIVPASVGVFADEGQCAAAKSSLKPLLALYVGGMGSRDHNFYNDLVKRYGYEAEAATIQDLYLSGHREQAVAAVPDGLVDEVSAIGSATQVREALGRYAAAGVDVLMVSLVAPDAASQLELLELLPSLV